MNYTYTLIFSVSILLFTACGEEETSKKSTSIENPVGTYLDSRTDALSLAKKSVKESNERVKVHEEAMESIK